MSSGPGLTLVLGHAGKPPVDGWPGTGPSLAELRGHGTDRRGDREDQADNRLRPGATGGERPGEKLPREADLAAELGLSRSSLREAVKALSLSGIERWLRKALPDPS
jgi:hypothetical protein